MSEVEIIMVEIDPISAEKSIPSPSEIDPIPIDPIYYKIHTISIL